MKNHSNLAHTPSLLGIVAASLLAGCSTMPYGNRATRGHAFISYWPPPENSGVRLAVKDLIDMKGEVTTAGSEYLAENGISAAQDAACMQIARERNVTIVGKTNLTEFAVTVSGNNDYYGTPDNRWDGRHRFVPGGSSSGSAVAVANGSADIAFGTDTAGSIRVPAAFCGIYGLKTTFGLVPTKGVFPISAKHLDTVGPMAADIPNLVEGMDLLQRGFRSKYNAAVADKPSARQIRIGRLYISGTAPAIDKAIDDALVAKGFRVVKLDERFRQKWAQADADGETIAAADAWTNDGKYLLESGIGSTTRTIVSSGAAITQAGYDAALKRKKAWQRDLARVFQKVDFIATPTLQILPPRWHWYGSSAVREKLIFDAQNTVGINFSGNPALAIPIAMPAEKDFVPRTSLQLVGPNRSEAQLLNAGRLLSPKP